jgi:hypothetical protein
VKFQKHVSAEDVRRHLDYDARTGAFTWRVSPSLGVKAGDPAGFSHDGYVSIGIKGKYYRAHRLAWLWMTGEWPAGEIDHENLRKNDNRWANLRLATHSQNQTNKRAGKNNTSGFKGVSFCAKSKAWRAQISVDHKKIYLGTHATKEEAHAAYLAGAEKHHGTYARAK